MALLARETRWRHGAVPTALDGIEVAPGHRLFAKGQFLLRCDSGYAYHYIPGEGVTIARPERADPDEEQLWLNGSVYAAIACLNGLYPFHASAVAYEGQVFAFTGPSGAGKSTLVAGLGQRGLPLFCDDTMLLDLSDPDLIIALPGHKQLKLADPALALTGARALAPVGSDTGKSYACPPAGTEADPLPLACLTFLEAAPACQLERLAGAQRLLRLDDDHYTQQFFLDVWRPTREHLFALRSRLARQLAMAVFRRPVRAEAFAKSLDLAEGSIRNFSNGDRA